MLPATVLPFLKKLAKNNNKVWFDANRDEYEAVRADFLQFIGKLIPELGRMDAAIGQLEPKQCIFRINRDVRFSKNKNPYKTNMAAYFNREGKQGKGAGYYLHIEPGKSFLAAGIWMPEAPELKAIRQEIDYHYPDWQKIVKAAAFRKHFPASLSKENALQRPPKGYDDDNPAVEMLKLKSFVVTKPIPDLDLTQAGFAKLVLAGCKAAEPMVTFLNQAGD